MNCVLCEVRVTNFTQNGD